MNETFTGGRAATFCRRQGRPPGGSNTGGEQVEVQVSRWVQLCRGQDSEERAAGSHLVLPLSWPSLGG